LKYISSALNHTKCRLLRVRQFGPLCGEMGAERSGRLFHLNIRWLMRKGAEESGTRNDTGSLLNEENHNFAERL